MLIKRDKSALKLVIIFLLISTIIVITGYVFYRSEKNRIKNTQESTLRIMADYKSKEIENWLDEYIFKPSVMFGGKSFAEEVDSYTNKGDKNINAVIYETLQYFSDKYKYRSILLLDKQGNVTLSVTKDSTEQVFVENRFVDSVKTSKKVYFSGLYFCQEHGEVRMGLLIPLLEKKDLTGILAFEIDPYDSLYPLINKWPGFSQSAEVLLVRKDGNDVLFLNELKYHKEKLLSFKLPLTQTNLPAVMAVNGATGIVEGNDYRNVPVLASLRKINGTDWYIVVKMNEEDIYADLAVEATWTIIAVLFFVVLAGLSLSHYWNRSSKNLYKQMYQLEHDRALLQGNFDQFMKNANDAVFLLTLDLKILDVNETAVKMYGFEIEEFNNLYAYELRIDKSKFNSEKFTAEIENKHGYIFESMHVRKNGEEFPVEVSSNIITIEGKKYIQSIIRDITERKKADRENKRLNRALRLISECNHILVRSTDEKLLLENLCNLIVSKAGYLFAWIGYMDNNKPEALKPVEHKGTQQEYIGYYLFSLSKEDLVKTPAGRSVSTLKPYIVNDNSNSELPGEWGKIANRSGFKSTIALPLIINNEAIGMLSIHSSDNNSFSSKEEIVLLQEMAEDLAFGINSLRLKEEKDRVKTELELSEEKYRNFFENDLTGDFISTPDGNILMCNKTFADTLGFDSIEECLKTNSKEFYENPNDRKEILKTLKDKKRIELNEFRLKKKNGEKIIVVENILAEFDESGEIKLITGYLFDITKRKKAEEQLLMLSKAVEQSPASIFMVNLEGKIEYVNPRFCETMGYSLEEIIGKDWDALKSDLTSEEIYDSIRQRIFKGKEWYGELENKTKSGKYIWESVLLSPIKNQLGNITHFVMIKEDITEQKETNQMLVEAKGKAEESNRLKSEFLAQMSHEIRTPINTVINSISLIKEDLNGNLNEDVQISFDIIDSSSKRIIRTIDSILNMSELQIGSYEKNVKEFDVFNDVLIDMAKEFKVLADRKNLELLLNKNTDNTIITADEYSVSQIFRNLIDNAIKYTKEGLVEINLREENNSLVADIKDTGIGISAEYLPNLFIPFSQEEQGYTRRFEGNGLGLALVKKYCELNNLEISAESEKRKGTKFTVSFPK